MYTFATLDTYKITHEKKDEKFTIDYKVLLRLYAPIIGATALSLYLLLESEASLNKHNKTKQSISRLHKLLQIDDSQFNNAINVLKEYGLITYKANQNKANDYLFVIIPCKSAVEFIADNKLNNALKVMVDEAYYKQVTGYFISFIINDDDYVDIAELKDSMSISEEEFYEQFYEKYPVIANASAINDETKKEINRLKKLFNLDYNEIENAILNSFEYVNDQMIIELNKLNNFINSKFKSKLVNESSDEILAKTFEQERSIAFYKKLSGRDILLPRESEMINELLESYPITEGILNVVISFYFKYGKNTISVSKNYFVKVIEEMVISGVKTTIDAMNYFRNRNKRIQNYKQSLENKPKVEYKRKDVVKQEEKVEVKETNEDVDLATIEEFRKLMGG